MLFFLSSAENGSETDALGEVENIPFIIKGGIDVSMMSRGCFLNGIIDFVIIRGGILENCV